MDNSKQPPTVLSLCPGSLGLERGLERAIGELDVITYVEIEAFAIENLARQMEQGVLAPRPIWSNVKTFLPIARRLRGKVDIITAGYPCQPLSHVGKQKGLSDDRWLWNYIEDIIDAVRPLCCFFENVSNHLNIGYREVRSSLEKLDYKVEQGIFTAEEAGAPHIRKRLFIMAYANNSWKQQPIRFIGESRGWIGNGGKKMDDSINSRLQGHSRNDGAASGREGSTRPTATTGFPMGQGYEQYKWEEPRMLESSMGVTVNGYNYREDLLRMAGNAVVEQTAELAFRTLYKKLFA